MHVRSGKRHPRSCVRTGLAAQTVLRGTYRACSIGQSGGIDAPISGRRVRRDLHMDQKTVLVIDDEPTFVSLLADLLEDEGYAVDRCFDGGPLSTRSTAHPRIWW